MMMVKLLSTVACISLLFAVGCSDDTVSPDTGIDAGGDGPVADLPGVEAGADLGDIGISLDGLDCQLAVESINTRPINQWQVISSLNDQDSAMAGIQLDVVVSVIGAPDGTSITLKTDSGNHTAAAVGGKATFSKVTVSQTFAVARFTPVGPKTCGYATTALSLIKDPACTITKPATGATLTAKDDESPGGALDYTVQIQTKDPQGGSVELSIGKAGGTLSPVGTITPNAFGTATFSKVSFPTEPQIGLEALVKIGTPDGDVTATCTSTITLDTNAPSCSLQAPDPAPITISIGQGMGPGQDGDTSSTGFQTTIKVNTQAGVDEVKLFIDYPGANDVTLSATPAGNVATFSTIDVKEGLNIAFTATCLNKATGNSGTSQTAKYTVDITPPPAVPAKSSTVPGGLECKVTHNRKGEVTCTFTTLSDGANGSGVEKYLVHYRKNSTIDAANFDDAETLAIQPDPLAVQTGTQTVKVDKLTMGDTFDFAVKAVDRLGNVGAVSEDVPGVKVDFKVQTLLGVNASGSFGQQIVVGNFNCDLYSDLAVGVSSADGKKGRVYLFFGTGSGLPTAPSKQIVGTLTNGLFGFGLAALNFDGDTTGCTDLAIHAYGRDTNRGRVYLYLGKPVWADRDDETIGKGADLVYKLPTTAAATERLGWRLSAVDLDGDGADDLALLNHDGTVDFANVLVMYGDKALPALQSGQTPPTKDLPGGADVQTTGGKFSAYFGLGLWRGGKLNADNYGELLIASPAYQVGTQTTGALYVLLGGARATTTPELIDITTSTRLVKIEGTTSNAGFGNFAAMVGDLNGDGTNEFAVADPNATVGTSTKAGLVYLFNLTGTLPSSSTDAAAVFENDLSPNMNSIMGRSVASGADVDPIKGADLDNDGYSDILISLGPAGSITGGSSMLFSGSAGSLNNRKASTANQTFTEPGSTTYFGAKSTYLFDVNGDQYTDIVISDYGYSSFLGRVFVYY